MTTLRPPRWRQKRTPVLSPSSRGREGISYVAEGDDSSLKAAKRQDLRLGGAPQEPIIRSIHRSANHSRSSDVRFSPLSSNLAGRHRTFGSFVASQIALELRRYVGFVGNKDNFEFFVFIAHFSVYVYNDLLKGKLVGITNLTFNSGGITVQKIGPWLVVESNDHDIAADGRWRAVSDFLALFLILQANHSHRSLEKIPRSFQRLSIHTDDCLPDLKPWAVEPSDLVLSY